MNRVRTCLMVALALLLTAALVSEAGAQDRRPSRRGFGRMRGSFLGLLSVEGVQKELKLNEDQIGKLKKIGEKSFAEMREQFAGLREIEDRQQRREKSIELARQLDEKARQQVSEVLSGEQMTRLYQVRLQVRGAVFGLNNSWIANRLKLTGEQKKKAAELEKATQEKVSGAFAGLRNLSEQERSKKMPEAFQKVRKIRSDANEQAVGLLNAEQKEEFEKLEGEKFELPSRSGR